MEEKKRYKVWVYIADIVAYFIGMVISNIDSFPAEIRFIGDALQVIAFYVLVAKGISVLTGILTKSKTAKTLSVFATVLVTALRIFQAIDPKFNTETYFLFILPVYLPLILAIWYIFWKEDEEIDEEVKKKKRFTLKNIIILSLLLLISLGALAANIIPIIK